MQERIDGRHRPRAPWVRRLELALWVVGIVTLATVGWGWLDGKLYQERQERLLEQALVEGAPAQEIAAGPAPRASSPLAGDAPASEVAAPAAPSGGERDREAAAATRTASGRDEPDPRPRAKRAAAASTEGLLARLTVPRLDMAVMVAEGLDSRTLRRAAGHIPGTAPLGSAGNVGLAGHRDSFFRPLRDIRVGDEIVLTTPQSVSTYRVEWTEVVTPQATEVLRSTPYPALTLVTCYPFTFVGTAPDRLVVRARLVESRAPSAPERVAALAGR